MLTEFIFFVVSRCLPILNTFGSHLLLTTLVYLYIRWIYFLRTVLYRIDEVATEPAELLILPRL
jgi:hypothetical protein